MGTSPRQSDGFGLGSEATNPCLSSEPIAPFGVGRSQSKSVVSDEATRTERWLSWPGGQRLEMVRRGAQEDALPHERRNSRG
eukprot:CAMPEP_0203892668 /NCGR_PEP_ID=MMETSP0359-20131031/35838_1 /ASSEMBLY_ACC=CAM_ASM_000338 /TAXON_ID=268821 /ORGANISM="Scrippsiella Hangoei, Strain SHTV-5" /LENGTH=81 /DNA_ID=CAMNT_0050814679 /DNA_START=186 /DNA_END=431 /DNA_ORIENTATION=+